MSGGIYRWTAGASGKAAFAARKGTFPLQSKFCPRFALNMRAFLRPALTVFALAAASLSLPSAAGVRSHSYRIALEGWRLHVATDPFSGSVACRLKATSGKMIYVAHAVGFRLGRHKDVTDAWVRIDGGEPFRWRDTLPELARMRVAIDGRDMASPTDGIVWLPAALLEKASRVDIQPAAGRRAKVFDLRGFAGLREMGRQRVCSPETRFVQ